MSAHSFYDYVNGIDWKNTVAVMAIYGELDFEMADRLRGPNAFGARDIYNLAALQKWARERWPDWYTRRGDNGEGVTGKRALAYLWAGFLAHGEDGS